MKPGNSLAILFVFVMGCLTYSPAYSQSELIGRWEGVHYYGDTTRLYDGSLLVRSYTIDSMRMILTIDEIQEGKFKGKLHEHFYSDPKKNYFNADVSGSINNEKIQFTSFDVKENRLPSGYRWCQPKATAILVKKLNSVFLHMAFESTLTCTVGPAIVERKTAEIIAKTPPSVTPAVVPAVAGVTQTVTPPVKIQPKQDVSSIAQNFKKRNQKVISTLKVQSDSIKVNFFDNGTVDGDSISVFVNGELRSSHVKLATQAYTISLYFVKGVDEIEVAMFAENLGSIPPNTALMQIVDGNKVHQAYLSSDTTSNATIKIRKVSVAPR